jgi:hypothetical protein
MNLPSQIAEEMTELAEQIDQEVLWTRLVEMGWVPVSISRLQDNRHAVDITYWLEKHCCGAYEREGRNFLFEDSQDATLFTLRWMS